MTLLDANSCPQNLGTYLWDEKDKKRPTNSVARCKVARWRPWPLPQRGELMSHRFFLIQLLHVTSQTQFVPLRPIGKEASHCYGEHSSWQIQMALHKQRGCLLEFLTNDPTLTNYQCRCQNPHNHSQCQNRQNQQNHSPLGNLQEKAFCYLLTQHPHPHETVITQNSSILRYLLYFGSSTCTIMVLNPGGRVSKSCILNLNHYLYSY